MQFIRVLSSAAGLLLLVAAIVYQKAAVSNQQIPVSLLEHQETFKPTKFGPLRKFEKSPHRYAVLALWRAAEHSLETCMDAVNLIFPHLQDTSCSDVDRAFQLIRRYACFVFEIVLPSQC